MQGVLNAIRPPDVGDGNIQGHARRVLHEISTSTGLTIDQYRKPLSQKLTQTEAQLESIPKNLVYRINSNAEEMPYFKQHLFNLGTTPL